MHMSKFEKLKQKIKDGKSISYEEAETILIKLGFMMRSNGSHNVFSKVGYEKNISIKRRTELLPYQVRLVEEAVQCYEEI